MLRCGIGTTQQANTLTGKEIGEFFRHDVTVNKVVHKEGGNAQCGEDAIQGDKEGLELDTLRQDGRLLHRATNTLGKMKTGYAMRENHTYYLPRPL